MGVLIATPLFFIQLMMAANYLLAFLYMRDDFASEQSADESPDESPDESQDESQDDIPDGTKDEDNFRKRDEAVSFKVSIVMNCNTVCGRLRATTLINVTRVLVA